MLTLALLLQAAAVPGEGADKLAAVRACPSGPGADGEVVVCARPVDRRLHPLSPPPGAEKHLDPSTFRIPGVGTAHLHAIQSALPGAEGQGVAATLTIPFGKRKQH